ncbi:sulfur carrier protein [Clostridium algifaecis]|uniref:Sulfur carrier protein n=1 Tax=Clostridium algifaecis TaxID=1472040 RepID=A0ABS4KW83_9CLOT|nr:sulfur carrier protein ThiS [Clostridium algifaecis]MBP2033681.1 sulfur carrier protein [Clostridium algifaecis]
MIVNGENMEFKDGMTVSDLLNNLNVEPSHVAVEIDLDIIDKNEFKTKRLDSNSKVEIIRFVGGG